MNGLSYCPTPKRREVDGAAAVFSTWRVEEESEVADGMYVRADRLALDACMTDERAARLLASLPEGVFLLRIKFLRDAGDWVLEDKFDPVRGDWRNGRAIVVVSRYTRPGALTGIDSVYYQNSYPVTAHCVNGVTAVVYGLFTIKDPDLANIDPLRDDLNCVAQRVIEDFEGALRDQGHTSAQRRKIREG